MAGTDAVYIDVLVEVEKANRGILAGKGTAEALETSSVQLGTSGNRVADFASDSSRSVNDSVFNASLSIAAFVLNRFSKPIEEL